MPAPIHRREFLESSARTGAAAGLALSAAGTALAQSSSDKVVVGVMGVSRGKALADMFAAQPNVEVKTLCDVDSKRADLAAESMRKAGTAKPGVTRDYRSMLDDKDIDALVCAAPNHWHAPVRLRADCSNRVFRHTRVCRRCTP